MDNNTSKPNINVEEIVAITVDPAIGLNDQQVKIRTDAGLLNLPVESPGKSVGDIVRDNVLTFFNILFFALAACVILVGSWRDALFLGVVFANIGIGIFQEIRAKRTLDKLTLVNAPRALVVRDGCEISLPTDNVVRDEVAIFKTGNQIYADALILRGRCSVNEALITGEADEIQKNVGDYLLSGSFIVSGECRAQLTKVGAESYAAKITLKAKEQNRSEKSGMMKSLDKLVKVIGILIVPLGILMALKEILWLEQSIEQGVVGTVAALIGMIPQGLYLLTSMALMASVVRLARKDTLVHSMSSIETLARVDVLCLDKTGTITENHMSVEDVVLLATERCSWEQFDALMADYLAAQSTENDTMSALRHHFTLDSTRTATQVLEFSSKLKYSAVSFKDTHYVLGAPEIILGEHSGFEAQINAHSTQGRRVLIMARVANVTEDGSLIGSPEALAFILLSNAVRENARETFDFFEAQGVKIKVISGDSPLSVCAVAHSAGIPDADNFIDARKLNTIDLLHDAATRYTVFGRVSPEQKRELIKALKLNGHTVAMTGDGVNDILALKEADCSIAMASGSDASYQVSNLVLLDSDFSCLPSVVAEGRRVINNIQRTASLFLVKNIFSFVVAILSLLFSVPFPITAGQMSLVSTMTIGIPGFVLAMEKNERLVQGSFLKNVMYSAIPGGITDILLVIGLVVFGFFFNVSSATVSAVCALVMAVVGLIIIHRLCVPYNRLRLLLMLSLSASIFLITAYIPWFFSLDSLDMQGLLLLGVFSCLAIPVLQFVHFMQERIHALVLRRRRKH